MTDEQQLQALLPPDGTPIPYEEWQNRINAAGLYALRPAIQSCRRKKLVHFGFDAAGQHLVALQPIPVEVSDGN